MEGRTWRNLLTQTFSEYQAILSIIGGDAIYGDTLIAEQKMHGDKSIKASNEKTTGNAFA